MIDIHYFASIKEQLNQGHEQLALHHSWHTVLDVRQHLCRSRQPIWDTVLNQDNVLVAVNHTMVSWDHPIKAGDELAFFPPMTGG